LSFPVIQEFGTLMQESIKKVTDIHKWKFFFMRACGPARVGLKLMQVGLLQAYGFTILARLSFFSRACRPTRQVRHILPSLS